MRTPRTTPGRPHKYGRPARLVALTLPEDVLQWLTAIHPDPAWAIVTICERATRSGQDDQQSAPAAELVQLPKCGGLIVVKPESLQDVKDVSTIPLADGRALIAMRKGEGIADLELALVEKLEDESLPANRRKELERVRQTLREWRKSSDLTFQSRSIIMARRSVRQGSAKHADKAAKPAKGVDQPDAGPRSRRPFLALSWWIQAGNVAVTHVLAGTAAQALASI
jgi:hypothetical protein